MTQISEQHGSAQRIVKTWLTHYRRSSRKARVGVLTVVLALVLLAMPSGYIVEQPGPVLDVLGTVSNQSQQQIIEITHSGSGSDGSSKDSSSKDSSSASSSKGSSSHTQSSAHTDKEGKLYMTTVNSYGVDGSVSNAFALLSYFIPSMGVVPTEAVIAPNQSQDEFDQQNQTEMTSAQDTAVQVATAIAKKQGIDMQGVKISVHIDDIGGPSAGMMYTLGILQKLVGRDLTGGKTIAGTGTISNNGAVGAIGGIRFKMVGAKSKGATWFIAPKANCADVRGHIPQGLQVVAVSNITQAYEALQKIGKGDTTGLPSCSVQ